MAGAGGADFGGHAGGHRIGIPHQHEGPHFFQAWLAFPGFFHQQAAIHFLFLAAQALG